MLSAFVSRMVILLFGTLYPAYASYKAVRTKNVKEYVKWMMYWIVYAFFTCIETFTDIFLSWFPFYYEVKVILVIWLLSPATKGSSTLYRKFVHPMLTRREHEIDEYLNQAKEKGYTTVLQLGSKGMNYATSVIMQTAIKSLGNGGGNQSSVQPPRICERDTVDSQPPSPRMTRSMSVDSALNKVQMEPLSIEPAFSIPTIAEVASSAEEDEVFEDDLDELVRGGNRGAARAREMPRRRTRVTKSRLPVKGRRRAKNDEPFVNVDD
ncbi:receptor expression-enhancing protein 1 isoform X5 [Phlebotomus papatasi]|uniref:receptor expression-enhancing protein 1 isoform X5 n=1 Tax=Phlebotomus papatasi TaxID=29031 RepID=UPI0024839BC4|nr:receptor expression-enhancing protein 1 isoform X5 [Phlebotomus papatasi]